MRRKDLETAIHRDTKAPLTMFAHADPSRVSGLLRRAMKGLLDLSVTPANAARLAAEIAVLAALVARERGAYQDVVEARRLDRREQRRNGNEAARKRWARARKKENVT